MSLTVKAYLYSSWNQDPVEIRRFTVEQEVATSYDYLVGKLRAVFPALKEGLFDVFWEGDDHVMFVYTRLPGVYKSLS